MTGNLLVHMGGTLFFLLMGIAFTFYSSRVREFYFEMYKKAAQKTELTKPWIDSYPLPYVFFISGIIFLAISVFLIYLLIKKGA